MDNDLVFVCAILSRVSDGSAWKARPTDNKCTNLDDKRASISL